MTQTGWPREYIDNEQYGRRMPNIWLGGRKQLSGDWLGFDDAHVKAEKQTGGSLCAVCGEALHRFWLFGHTGHDGPQIRAETNGPAVHPRCFALTLKFCPHFAGVPFDDPNESVAWLWDRECGRPWWSTFYDYGTEDACSTYRLSNVRKTYRADVVSLAKSNPLGE